MAGYSSLNCSNMLLTSTEHHGFLPKDGARDGAAPDAPQVKDALQALLDGWLREEWHIRRSARHVHCDLSMP